MPGSGKTTLARSISNELKGRGLSLLELDGDEFRRLLGGQDGYTNEAREKLARTYLAIAMLSSIQGHIALVSSVSAFRFVEESLREQSSRNRIIRLDVSLEMMREARPNLYKSGQYPVDPSNFPRHPDLQLRADSPEERREWLPKAIEEINGWL